jgi:RecA-family ATPase
MAELDEKTKAEIAALAALDAPDNVLRPAAFNQPSVPGASAANAPPPHTPAPASVPIPGVFDADELLSQPAPQRRWCVESWIPKAENTLCAGDGGQGKTTLALQLAVACTGGGLWLGLPVERCNVLYGSAEDPIGEIHYRLEQIKRQFQVTQLRGLTILDVAGMDATLARFKQNGQLEPTPLFHHLEQVARGHRTGLVVLDAVADFFGGNENDRGEVRSFIGMLRGLAMRLDSAVLIVAHPSVDGIRSGRGYSGSTHWNNAVRSRLMFTTPIEDDGKERDPDLRVLELAKSNRARRGAKIHMRWWEGCFMGTTPGEASTANDQYGEQVSLELLDAFTQQERTVSSNPQAGTYAPAQFAKKKRLDAAKQRLFAKRLIKQVVEGPKSKPRGRIIRVLPGDQAAAGP